jgi:cell division initiation protein
MQVTGLEIRQQQFSFSFRGYDPPAVDMFLDRVAGRLEELVQENAQLWEALAQKDREIEGIRGQEKGWKKALLTVQQTRDDLIARAQQEAQSLMTEAQHQVDQLLSEAEKARQAITQDVHLLMCQKRQLMDALQHLLNQHLALLQVQEGQEERRQFSEIPEPARIMLAAPSSTANLEYATTMSDNSHKPQYRQALERK